MNQTTNADNKVNNFNTKQFIMITLIASIWIQIGEFARGFIVAFPRMQEFWGANWENLELGRVEASNVTIWTGWGFLLAFVLGYIVWTSIHSMGNNRKTLFIAGTMTTLATLVISWIANVNTGFGSWDTALILCLIAWVELLVAAFIMGHLYKNNSFSG